MLIHSMGPCCLNENFWVTFQNSGPPPTASHVLREPRPVQEASRACTLNHTPEALVHMQGESTALLCSPPDLSLRKVPVPRDTQGPLATSNSIIKSLLWGAARQDPPLLPSPAH